MNWDEILQELKSNKSTPEIEDCLQGSSWTLCHRGNWEELDFNNLKELSIQRIKSIISSTWDVPPILENPFSTIPIGIGTYKWNYDKKIIETALNKGVKLVDTSESYGFGKVLKELSSIPFHLFKDSVLASKFSKNHNSGENVLSSSFRLLKAFPTTKLHQQLHWPSNKYKIEDTSSGIKRSFILGAITSFGVCNCSIDLLVSFSQKLFPVPIFTNQIKYNLFHRNPEKILIPYCKSKGIRIIAYSPLGQNFKKILKQEKSIQYFSQKLNCSPSQVLLSWIIGKGVLPIPATNNIFHLEENLDSVNLSIPKDILDEIESEFPL